jgi:hypothetical protein
MRLGWERAITVLREAAMPAMLLAAIVGCVASISCKPAPADRAPVAPTPRRPGEPPLQEPQGLAGLNEQPWDALTGNDWRYTRRTASRDATIVTDTTAPLSPPHVLRIIYTTDMSPNTEPGANWLPLSNVKEIYTGWWMKVSPNWTCNPAGCGKITFIFAQGGGNVYTNLYHKSDTVQGPPFRIGSNTEWAPYGQEHRTPNVTTTYVYPGQWHRIEFYYKYESSPGAGDGIIRWWVDGVLNGNYTNIYYPTSPFVEFLYAPTIQFPPPAEQYMYIDHTRVSRR